MSGHLLVRALVALGALGVLAVAVVVGTRLAASSRATSSRDGSPDASETKSADRSTSSEQGGSNGSSASPASTRSSAGQARRPHIVWKPIPFDARRRRETAAYAMRHYGIRTSELKDPKVIVEHYTGGSSFLSAWNTFAGDRPDPGLGELPGTCAHFIVDTEGTIYQLVPLHRMCRHAVGLNWTAFGIEHVGTSDRQILDDRAQLHASLRLTLWLMMKFHIGLHGVIGHNESLTSPFHHERYPSWRCQTHADWTHADMQVYRAQLSELAQQEQVRLALGASPTKSSC